MATTTTATLAAVRDLELVHPRSADADELVRRVDRLRTLARIRRATPPAPLAGHLVGTCSTRAEAHELAPLHTPAAVVPVGDRFAVWHLGGGR
jgi:hypothetical protein